MAKRDTHNLQKHEYCYGWSRLYGLQWSKIPIFARNEGMVFHFCAFVSLIFLFTVFWDGVCWKVQYMICWSWYDLLLWDTTLQGMEEVESMARCMLLGWPKNEDTAGRIPCFVRGRDETRCVRKRWDEIRYWSCIQVYILKMWQCVYLSYLSMKTYSDPWFIARSWCRAAGRTVTVYPPGCTGRC